jgi:undecaprenyl-diphosphatase
MIEQLKDWDTQFLLFLNQFHTSTLDPIMLTITKTEFWTPLFLLLIYLVFKNYKNDGWIVLLGVGLCILMTDQITSTFMKPFFQRLRPSHEPTLEGIIHLASISVGNFYRGGLYSFASGHAANTTGIACFIFLLFRSTYRWIWTIFIWAFIMSYTRIYLGVHYPGDIIVGALIGLLCGWIAFRFYLWLSGKIKKRSSAVGDAQGG